MTMSRESDAARSVSPFASSEVIGMVGLALEAQGATQTRLEEIFTDIVARLERLEGGQNAIRVTTAEQKELQLAAASFMDVPRKEWAKWLSLQYKKRGLNVSKKVIYDPTKFVIKDVVAGSVIDIFSLFGRPIKIAVKLMITVVVVAETVHYFYSLPASVQLAAADIVRTAYQVVSPLGTWYFNSRLGAVAGLVDEAQANLQNTAQAIVCNPAYPATGWTARTNPWYYIRPAFCRA